MKTAVVSGIGYIGSQLVSHLLGAGYRVLAVDNWIFGHGACLNGLDHYGSMLEFHHLDIRSQDYRDLCQRAEIIYHLAARVGAGLCDKNEKLAKEVNQTAVEDLVGSLKGQRLIFPNTNSGYGIKSDGLCTEDSALTPISCYGVTKCEAEKAVRSYPNHVCLRLATIFGGSRRVRMDLLVNTWVAELYYFKKLKVFEGSFRRNFLHNQDAVRCLRYMEDPKFNGVYNCGNDDLNMTKDRLAQRICNILDIDTSCLSIGDSEDPDKRNYEVSSQKLLKTGFTFKYGLQEGVLEVLAQCKRMGYEILKCGNVSL